jgi:hypothetical protein
MKRSATSLRRCSMRAAMRLGAVARSDAPFMTSHYRANLTQRPFVSTLRSPARHIALCTSEKRVPPMPSASGLVGMRHLEENILAEVI